MNEQTIFTEALERDHAERSAYLDEACGSDQELRERVEKLIGLHEIAGNFLERPAAGASPTLNQTALEIPGTLIGPFKLLQQIGEGGMGVVYMAEQKAPVERRVALKIIKAGMDTRQVIARFEAERQALAMMDHQNIAKVFEAGTTESGRPYFVMELVKGIPITRYCDEKRLSLKERLELMIPVCQAIQHAHQKGIIHRDIKPTNVLVAQYDGRPVPKVIDFGVAKATAQRLTERTMFTELGQVVGTLEYMSPEQAELNQLDIDTRSDIYSLGVLLYELLTGSTPFDKQKHRTAAFHEMLRMIREDEPSKPSVNLSTSSTLPSIAVNRQTEPARLSQAVRGELDWIVMKALEKDRNRRYETANLFAADIQRYLSDEAVQACPPSAGYRFGKFARRNKGPVLAAAVIFVALVAGIAGMTWGLVRAENARQDAVKAQVAALARETETKAVLDFVENKVFAAARPQDLGGLGGEVTLRKAVEAALPFVAASFTDQPLIEARLRMTLGLSFKYRGDAKMAAKQFETARALYTHHLGVDHPDTLRSMSRLASSYFDLGQPAEALQLREQTLALMKAQLGLDHPDTLGSMSSLASSYQFDHRFADDLRLKEQKLALQKAKLGADHIDVLRSMTNLADAYCRYDAACFRAECAAVIDATDKSPVKLLGQVAGAKLEDAAARKLRAEALRNDALAIVSKLDAHTSEEYLARGTLYETSGDADAAMADYDKSLEIAPDNAPRIAKAHCQVAWRLATSPDLKSPTPQRAVELSKKALELWPKRAGQGVVLGVAHYRAGNCKEALDALKKAMPHRAGGDCTDWFFLAMVYWQLGDKSEARMWFDRAEQLMKTRHHPDWQYFRAEAAELLGIKDEPQQEKARAPKPDGS